MIPACPIMPRDLPQTSFKCHVMVIRMYLEKAPIKIKNELKDLHYCALNLEQLQELRLSRSFISNWILFSAWFHEVRRQKSVVSIPVVTTDEVRCGSRRLETSHLIPDSGQSFSHAHPLSFVQASFLLRKIYLEWPPPLPNIVVDRCLSSKKFSNMWPPPVPNITLSWTGFVDLLGSATHTSNAVLANISAQIGLGDLFPLCGTLFSLNCPLVSAGQGGGGGCGGFGLIFAGYE